MECAPRFWYDARQNLHTGVPTDTWRSAVTFKEILDQVMTWLQQDQRISYRAVKRQFALEDDYLDNLKVELIEVKQVAVDQDGKVLVWTGKAVTAPPAVTNATVPPERAPLTYTPPYLAEKILTSRSALEGERKQVTVLFADLKGSTELIRDLDPEQAQAILDPALHAMMDAVHRYEGTVNQVLGDGVMALFRRAVGPRRPRRPGLLCGAGDAGRPPSLCRRGAPHPRPAECRCALGSTPATSWCAPLRTTCIWTTPPSA